MEHGDLQARAVTAWFKECKREGKTYEQPSGGTGVTEFHGRRYVVLSNANGILAVYRVRPDGILKRLKRWPPELA
jgi:hypothetical protein